MIKVSYRLNIEDTYYKLISESKMKKFNNRTFESYYNQYIKSKLNDYTLKELLCGKYEELLDIKDDIGTKYNSKTNSNHSAPQKPINVNANISNNYTP